MSKKQQESSVIDRSKTKDFDYNDWFAYFLDLPARKLLDNRETIADELPAVGYAAFMRWMDIFENPSKMDKIIKAQVDEGRQSDLIDLAVGEDDEAYYEGIIKEIAIQMNSSGTSPQEFARLAANMNIARKELREIRSRRPKKGTKLDSILTKIAEIDQKSTKTVAKSAKLSKKKSTTVKTTPPEPVRATKKKKTTTNTSKKPKKDVK